MSERKTSDEESGLGKVYFYCPQCGQLTLNAHGPCDDCTSSPRELSDEDIKYLHTCLKAGLRVWYRDPHGDLFPVYHVGRAPAPAPGDVPEPTEVAYFGSSKEAWGVHYAALSACTRQNFIVTTHDIANWPEPEHA